MGSLSKRDETHEEPKIAAAAKKYKSVDLGSELISDFALTEMFVFGRYQAAPLSDSLARSHYFMEPQSEPPWRVIASFRELHDEVIKEAIDRLNQQLLNQEITDSGEMLHTFAIRMMLASNNIIDKSIDDVTAESRSYIDNLLDMGQLPPRELNYQWTDEFSRSSGGYVYWVTPQYQENFKEIYKYLVEARSKAFERSFESYKNEILELIAGDGRRFFEAMCYTASNDNKFAAVSILQSIDPGAFVTAVMDTKRANWYWIGSALKERFQRNRADQDFEKESGWLSEVIVSLKSKQISASALDKARLSELLDNLQKLPVSSPLPSPE